MTAFGAAGGRVVGSVRRSVAAAALCLGVLVTASCGPGAAVLDPVASDGGGTVLDDRPGSRESASDGGGAGAGAAASDAGGDVVAADVPAPDPKDYTGMDQHTPEGAEQFTRYVAAVRIWGMQTGRSDLFREVSASSCPTCDEVIARMDRLSSNGAYWPDVMIEPAGSSTEKGDVGEIVGIHGYTVPEIKRRSEVSAGEIVTFPREEHLLMAALNWSPEGWEVVAIAVQTRPEQ